MILQRVLFVLCLLATLALVLAGYCSTQSNNCGQHCLTQTDCHSGVCLRHKEWCLGKLATGKCNRGTKCGRPCSTNSDCIPPEGGQCWKEVKCGYCNYLSQLKCGDVCGVDADCSPGSCWAVIAPHECSDILKLYCDTESGDKCGKLCRTGSDSDCTPGHCVSYQAQCGNSTGYCSLESKNCGAACSKTSNCSGGYCLKNKESCTTTITIGTYIGALPGTYSSYTGLYKKHVIKNHLVKVNCTNCQEWVLEGWRPHTECEWSECQQCLSERHL